MRFWNRLKARFSFLGTPINLKIEMCHIHERFKFENQECPQCAYFRGHHAGSLEKIRYYINDNLRFENAQHELRKLRNRIYNQRRKIRQLENVRKHSWYYDVLAFHEKFSCKISDTPQFLNREEAELRWGLITEELKETLEAHETKDMEKFADGLADLIYVLIGTAISYGIPLDEVWEEVQRTNMNKVPGILREDGKILKPEGWIPPDIEGILNKHGYKKNSKD